MTAINSIPFFFKSHADTNNGGLPQSLPFYLYFDNDLKMFRQKSTPELIAVLDKIYKQGSLVEGSVSSESGKVYIEKMISYIFDHFNFKNDSIVLEVGFGSGILLKELKQKGIQHLTGIEPGNHKRTDGLDGIKLIKDFFPSEHFKSKADLIYSFGILEHIEDPLSFLMGQINQLSENGKIIFSVPNCEPYLKEGDLSVFIHEHYSYFTHESIIRLVNKTGFKLEDISVIEGAFVVTICKNAKDCQIAYESVSEEDFNKNVLIHLEKINYFFDKYAQSEIAVYAPARAVNALFIAKKTNVRLVDDNSELHGRYLPSLLSPVESYDELVLNPPKCLLVFSRTFGERIKQKCKSDKRLQQTLIVTLNDLDNN